ncbi:uncharacterized protein LOC119390397 isoform X1 [Rhipicephalus sanguineus]|uniref:uncharacterized protein LOC119390397 isoform X1 n=1 Tax=Rhipicephalus sanguineus TaxID=34632 RepID=UPI001893ED8B|nr:uncharacterized protein LOC119390397 isoform X1 [Rhipicephalus sanguineus]
MSTFHVAYKFSWGHLVRSRMRHQQSALKFLLRCSVAAGIIVCLSTGFELLLERADSGAEKNAQVGSTGQVYVDCLSKNGTPINDGGKCALMVVFEERKENVKQTCMEGVCRNGTCTNINKTDCSNNK